MDVATNSKLGVWHFLQLPYLKRVARCSASFRSLVPLVPLARLLANVKEALTTTAEQGSNAGLRCYSLLEALLASKVATESLILDRHGLSFWPFRHYPRSVIYVPARTLDQRLGAQLANAILLTLIISSQQRSQ